MISYNPTPEDLPEYASTIAEIAGVAKTIEYCQSFGGFIVYFRKWNDDASTWSEATTNIVECLGKANAKKVINKLHGEQITLPICGMVSAKVRAQKVINDRFLHGLTIRRISEAYRLHERRIRQIIAAHQKAWLKEYGSFRSVGHGGQS